MPSHQPRRSVAIHRSLPPVSGSRTHRAHPARAVHPSTSFRTSKKLLLIVPIVTLLALFIGRGGSTPQVHAQQPQTRQSAQSRSAYNEQLQQAIETAQLQNPKLDIAVSTVIDDGKIQTYGSQALFDGASTAKLITAVDYLKHVENRTARLNQIIAGLPAQTWLKRLIVDSDDEAWNVLNNYLGHPDLAKFGASVGFKNYNPGTNTLSPADIALLLQKLYQGDLLQAKHQQLLLGYMKQANYREYIVQAALPGSTVYHKIGMNADSLHDAAIITKGGKTLTLVIFTDGHGIYDWGKRAAIMHDITRAAERTLL